MTTQTATQDVNGPEPDLKRVMGPKLLLLFIVGDILGAGVYAVTGQMAGVVGGIVWLPFLVAFVVATLTALSYLELVTKYPQAAGAALYAHKAFGLHFVTFLVAFAVICSGGPPPPPTCWPRTSPVASRPTAGSTPRPAPARSR
jgi:APA family basic amino acid/polyamine antiporter